MTKVMRSEMLARQLLEDAQPRHTRPSAIDLAILAQHAQMHRDESDKSFRYLVSVIGVVVAIVFVGLLIAAWREQSNMTKAQQETIQRIVN